MAFTTTAVLESIRRRAMLPDSDATFSDLDLLDMVEDELRYFGVPHLLSAREEYLVTHIDIPLVENQLAYTIPYRAVGGVVRDVYLVDDQEHLYELSRVELDDISSYQNLAMASTHSGIFYLENDKIKFPAQQMSSSGYLRIYYYLEPNRLVAEKYIGVITDINRTTGVITLQSFPELFANLGKMDFIQERTPNKTYSFDITPTSSNQNAKSLTFAVADIPDDLSVNDYIASAQETCVLQLPKEFQKLVCQRVAVQALESMGDEQGKQSAESRLKQMETSTLQLIINRVQGDPVKINSRRSTLRTSVGNRLNRRGW